MESKIKSSLFIFRRDLRLIDNKALLNTSLNSKSIIASFFFDERQVNPKQNEYYSSNSVQFMVQSLIDINNQLSKVNSKLYIFYGNLIENLDKLFDEVNIESVYVNQDYTPFSIKRDEEIKQLCQKRKISFNSYEDILLTNLRSVLLSNGQFYKKFTPYYNAASLIPIPKVDNTKITNFAKIEIKSSIGYKNEEDLYKLLKLTVNENVEVKGGQTEGEKILEKLFNFKNYKNERDYPIIPTTRLSAYLKFGCVSVREVYSKVRDLFGSTHDLIRQLVWRDFYTKITFFYPHVVGGAMNQNYNKVKWEADENHVQAWKDGQTGYPIVDAAMRCLNKTGYMHNRLRMVVSSFLVKDLLCDWRIGEKYFANKLIDYDVSLNNGGWQWSAGTGVDSMPYFRIFNPTSQSEKFDSSGKFILQWVPELKNVRVDHIHDWEKFHKNYKVEYPNPIVSHAKQKEKIISLYKNAVYDEDQKSGVSSKNEGINNKKKKVEKVNIDNSGFSLFSIEERSKILHKNPNFEAKQVVTELNKRWKNLHSEEKDLWNVKADEESLGNDNNKRKISKPKKDKKEVKEKTKPNVLKKKKKTAEDSSSSFSDDE